MHKNYQPVKPVTNKLLKKKWDGTVHDMHRKKVMAAKPIVDSKSPSTYTHLQYKLKKVQLEEERHATIDRDNRILLEKMSSIMRTRGRVDNWNDYTPKSLNKNKRTRELIRVTLENQKILARIQAKQPQYSAKKWEDDWVETKRYMGAIRKYSEDWYQQLQAEKRAGSSRGYSKRSSRATVTRETTREAPRQDTAVSKQLSEDEIAKAPENPKPAKSEKAPSPKPKKAASPKPTTPPPSSPTAEPAKPSTPTAKPSTPTAKPASPVAKPATPPANKEVPDLDI